MASLLTYDITSKHTEFKKEMLELGYLDQISGNTCKIIYFPNTSLYHPNNTPERARIDAELICTRLRINLERCVATVWDNWSAICGEPFK